MGRRGHPHIFSGKSPQYRYQGIMSERGSAQFEAARARLAKLAGWKADDISDGDTFEYLARGDQETRRYLREKKQATKTN